MQLELFNNKESEENTTDLESYCCNKCGENKPYYVFRPSALEFLRKEKGKSHGGGNAISCKPCMSLYSKSKTIALRNAPPKPKGDYACDCCGKVVPNNKIHLDHDHANHTFRGWICRNCNTGLGSLGDNVEGLEQAIAYLRRTDERT